MLYNFSQERRTPFAPELKYFIAEAEISDPTDELKKLKTEILSKEKSIINSHEYVSDWGTRMGKNSLTSRANNYNLLDFDNTKVLRNSIVDMHTLYVQACGEKMESEKYYIQCWANVMRPKEKIYPHKHSGDSYSYISGHVCLQVEDTYTHYIHPFDDSQWKSDNIVNKITLFPSFIVHYTDPVPSGQTRITVAFDIITEEAYYRDLSIYKSSTLIEL